MPLYGAIEAGGTKFVVAVGEDPAQPRQVERFPTLSTPNETIAAVLDYFRRQGPVAALGIATFGPVDFATGSITNTPKLAWQNCQMRQAFQEALGVPIGFDTDVNGAALGEIRCGAGRGLNDLVYITVGTGIGGGAICGGRMVHGLMHPEMGHLLVRRAEAELPEFQGSCPFHGCCLEGMASGPSMEARWGRPAHELPMDHPGWALEADYIAQACVNLACVLSPRMIVLGGGVMSQRHLFPLIRRRAEELSQGYLPLASIVPPGLEYPGLTGALVLAQDALDA